MVLLEMIIQVTVRAMAYLCPQLSFDSLGIGVMPIGRHPLWHTTGDGPGRAEERFGRHLVTGLAQQHIDEVPVAINRPVQIRVCQKAGELGRLLQLFPVVLHSWIPSLEGSPEFIVEDARAYL